MRASWTETKRQALETKNSGGFKPSSSVFRLSRTASVKGFLAESRASLLTHIQIARQLDAYQAGNFTIDPLKTHWVQIWDMVIAMALVYTAVVPPAEIVRLRAAGRSLRVAHRPARRPSARTSTCGTCATGSIRRCFRRRILGCS